MHTHISGISCIDFLRMRIPIFRLFILHPMQFILLIVSQSFIIHFRLSFYSPLILYDLESLKQQVLYQDFHQTQPQNHAALSFILSLPSFFFLCKNRTILCRFFLDSYSCPISISFCRLSMASKNAFALASFLPTLSPWAQY